MKSYSERKVELELEISCLTNEINMITALLNTTNYNSRDEVIRMERHTRHIISSLEPKIDELFCVCQILDVLSMQDSLEDAMKNPH